MNEASSKTIPVVIFCGGRGTRLKEETEFKPKPMVTVGGKPMLWHIMKIYSHYGFNRFIICLGYKGDYIKDYFLRHKFLSADFCLKAGNPALCGASGGEDNWEIIFADTGEDTHTGERLLMVRKYVSDDLFMVTYGDGVANIDIRALLEFHKKQNIIGTITGVHPTSKWGLVSVENDRVTTFDQKPRLHDYVNGGFMVFNQEFMNRLRPGRMIEDLLAELAWERQLALYKHEGFWHCVDTYQDYETLNKLWAAGPQWKIWE